MDNTLPKLSFAKGIIDNYLHTLFPNHFDFGGKMCLVQVDIERIKGDLLCDAAFALESDPAAGSLDEIILCYPGFYATAVYRLSHALYGSDVMLLPRMLSEIAHSRTGIDIHPGASIGCPFFIDHGTGVVIGETAVIGNRVKIYQGVTIGARSVDKERGKNKKRHPTIGDECVIYAGATILGGDTVIGDRCVIGGNAWLTHSIPSDTTVIYER